MNRAPAFRLVDDFQAGYIKFQGREPRSLYELAIAREEARHAGRVAELRKIAKKMALLDEHLPALAERGFKFGYRDIDATDDGKTLRIQTGTFSLEDDKLHRALLELGFREVARTSYGSRDQATLQHGRWLLVKIDVTRPAAAPAVEQQPAPEEAKEPTA